MDTNKTALLKLRRAVILSRMLSATKADIIKDATGIEGDDAAAALWDYVDIDVGSLAGIPGDAVGVSDDDASRLTSALQAIKKDIETEAAREEERGDALITECHSFGYGVEKDSAADRYYWSAFGWEDESPHRFHSAIAAAENCIEERGV